MYNAVAQQAFGTLGTICWSGQLVPQIWKSWREKSVDGLSHWLLFSWGIAAAFLGTFAIVQKFAISLIIQPQLFGLLGLISWAQCLYYGLKKTKSQASIMLFGLLALIAAFQVGMVYAVRPSVEKGNVAGAYFFGIGTSVLLILGLLPQYVEIFRLGEVKGISLTFITIDILGGIFSIFALAFSGRIDVLACVAYSLVVVFDSVIIILAIILNPRAARRRSKNSEGGVMQGVPNFNDQPHDRMGEAPVAFSPDHCTTISEKKDDEKGCSVTEK